LNGTQKFLVSADNVHSLGHNVNITNKNTEVLPDANKEDGLEVNIEETKKVSVLSSECRTKSQ
jgi:hypothetical protein